MNELRTKKALKILELAMMLNDTKTQRGYTGPKPTVFVEFLGHIHAFEVSIYSRGWYPGADSNFEWNIWLSDNTKLPDRELDECLAKLTELSEKWKIELLEEWKGMEDER